MKKLNLVLLLFVLLSGCNKSPEMHHVTYEASEAVSTLHISYKNPDGDLISVNPTFNSSEDIWTVEGIFPEGEIVYISATYDEEGGTQRIRILLDGKTLKQAESRYQPGEEGRVTLAGVVPWSK